MLFLHNRACHHWHSLNLSDQKVWFLKKVAIIKLLLSMQCIGSSLTQNWPMKKVQRYIKAFRLWYFVHLARICPLLLLKPAWLGPHIFPMHKSIGFQDPKKYAKQAYIFFQCTKVSGFGILKNMANNISSHEYFSSILIMIVNHSIISTNTLN